MSSEHEPHRARWTLSLDEAGQWLDEVADTIPPELFNHLNGGVVLSEDIVPSPHGDGLYTLGVYHHDPLGLGRYIVIYYGSFVRVHGSASPSAQKKALRDVLLHELTHHVESLAGVRDLEVKDERDIERYKKAKDGK